MVRFNFAAVLAFAVLTIVVAQELYDDKYDDMDVMAILENDSLRAQYYNCLMDTGPCVTEDAKLIRQHFAEALATKCGRCTQKQKENGDLLVAWYTEHHPEEWEALVSKMAVEARKYAA